MEILEIKDRNIWNEFAANQKPVQFLQSFEWGEFQESLKRKIWHLAILESNEILAVCLLVKNKLPLGKSYFYSPRGPIFAKSEKILNPKFEALNKFQILNSKFRNFIRELVKEESAIFWRLEVPILLNFWNEGEQKFITKLSIRRSLGEGGQPAIKVSDVQPSKTLILDLSKSEEQLLLEMHSKTRYNIKLAEKSGINIRYSTIPEDKKNFLSLLRQTALRDNFKPHSDFYYQKMFKILERTDIETKIQGVSYFKNELYEQCFLRLIKAEYQGKILAANILMYFGDTVTYLHGASFTEKRNLMAPFLLQWQAICDAKELGYQYYDFWGVDEKKWPGVTRFKLGFGGRIIEYPGTFDLILDKFWCKLYQFGKHLKNF